jgi:hypothetical protein cdivTM_02431
MADGSSKQRIIDSIKDVTNILVTVSANPSVDELSAALALTIFLNKLGKHATAVFSGEVPPAISFLNPDKTFEQTANSLRDFIIALDKEKADHLRYKVVDDAVKIFITPYRTTISEKDLEFSQGDYNVELVVALNVENSERIDAALTAHGRILHDAIVVTMTAGGVKSGLGSVDWHEDSASGVSEMMVELINDLRTQSAALDEQIATALLTGIVAVTNRFSNNLTSSRVMTVAANLMAIGANQQLVAMKIAESEARAERPQAIEEAKDRKKPDADKKSSESEQARADGALSINHEKEGSLDEVSHQTIQEKRHEAAQSTQTKLAHIEMVNNSAAPSRTDSTAGSDDNEDDEPAPVKPPEIKLPPVQSSVKTSTPEPIGSTPLMGGTLNATTEQAVKDKERELQNNQNKTILTHGEYIGSNEPSFGDTPLNAAMGKSDEPPKIDPFANNSSTAALPGMGAPETPPASPADESIMDAIAKDTTQLTGKPAAPASPAVNDRESALAAVDAALSAAPPAAAAVLPAQPAQGPMQSASKSATPTLAELEAAAPASSAPTLPPMPDFSTLPPIPPAPTGTPAGLPPVPPLGGGMPSAPVAPEPAAAPQSTGFNPSQFQIPGQK